MVFVQWNRGEIPEHQDIHPASHAPRSDSEHGEYDSETLEPYRRTRSNEHQLPFIRPPPASGSRFPAYSVGEERVRMGPTDRRPVSPTHPPYYRAHTHENAVGAPRTLTLSALHAHMGYTRAPDPRTAPPVPVPPPPPSLRLSQDTRLPPDAFSYPMPPPPPHALTHWSPPLPVPACPSRSPSPEPDSQLRAALGLSADIPTSLAALPDPPAGSRPEYSLPILAALAIHGSPRGMLTLQELYWTLEVRFQWFAERSGEKGGWKGSIRHMLSLEKIFRLVPGHYWTLDLSAGRGNKRKRRRGARNIAPMTHRTPRNETS